jgi:hypothetical protein
VSRYYDVRTCVVTREPCPVCGCTSGAECSADFVGDSEYRWWACGRHEERWPGGEWRAVKECEGR